MPTGRHNIWLGFSGPWERQLKTLYRELEKNAQSAKKFASTKSSAIQDQIAALGKEQAATEASWKAGERQERRGRSVRQRQAQMIRSAATAPLAAVSGGMGAGPIGAAGGGAEAVGGMLQNRGMLRTGVAVAAGGMIAKFLGQQAASFAPILEQLQSLRALTGTFGGETTRAQLDRYQALARETGIAPRDMRQAALIIAQQTGEAVEDADMKQLGLVARTVGMQAEELAQFRAIQERFGTGQAFTDAIVKGTAAGLTKGQMPEFLKSIVSLQQQQAQAGVEDRGEMAATLARLGEINTTWEGQFGAAKLQGMAGAFRGAAAGAGGFGANLMFSALSAADPSAGYYKLLEQMEKGATDENITAVVRRLEKMGGTEESRARLLQRVFTSLTYTDALALSRDYADDSPARRSAREEKARLALEDAGEAYMGDETRYQLQSKIATDVFGEEVKSLSAGIVGGLVKEVQGGPEQVDLQRRALTHLRALERGEFIGQQGAFRPVDPESRYIVAAKYLSLKYGEEQAATMLAGYAQKEGVRYGTGGQMDPATVYNIGKRVYQEEFGGGAFRYMRRGAEAQGRAAQVRTFLEAQPDIGRRFYMTEGEARAEAYTMIASHFEKLGESADADRAAMVETLVAGLREVLTEDREAGRKVTIFAGKAEVAEGQEGDVRK